MDKDKIGSVYDENEKKVIIYYSDGTKKVIKNVKRETARNYKIPFLADIEADEIRKNGTISEATYKRYLDSITNRQQLLKKIASIIGIAAIVALFISIILLISIGIPWGFIGLGIIIFALIITTGIIMAPVSKKKEAVEAYEHSLIEKRNAEQRERETQKLTNIKKTVIVHTATKRDNDDTLTRGIVGGILFGTAGAVVGSATGKEKDYTTFLIIYNDSSRETMEVQNGSTLYNHYIKFLEI